jgi:hypothetical protein
MTKRLLRFHPSFGVPRKTSCDKIYEMLIVTAEYLLQRFTAWSAAATLGINDGPRSAA